MYGMCVWMYLDYHMLVEAPRTAVVAMQGHPGPPAFRLEKASGEWATTVAYVCVEICSAWGCAPKQCGRGGGLIMW